MPDYKMDIRGNLGVSEYSDIYDYMKIVDENDNFTITLDEFNKQHLNEITSILKQSDFFISKEGVNTSGNYYINVNKYK